MKNPFIVKPTGLKGNEKVNRMKELMGVKPLNEDVKNSVVELTKLGPDGKVYGIVREGHNYFIKVTDKQSNIVTEDFNYIGGLMNKTSEAYPSYAKAIKQLNLKFMSLNEAYGKKGNFNVFEDDNLLTENEASKHIFSQAEGSESSYGEQVTEANEAGNLMLSNAAKQIYQYIKLNKYDANLLIDGKRIGSADAPFTIQANSKSMSSPNTAYIVVSGFGPDENTVKDTMTKLKNLILKTFEFLVDFGDVEVKYNGIRKNFNGNFSVKVNPDMLKTGKVNEDVKLSESEMAIEEMLVGEKNKEGKYYIPSHKEDEFKSCKAKIKESRTGFSIESALEKMDSIIDEGTNDKVTEILNSLTESEKEALLSTLKKKV